MTDHNQIPEASKSKLNAEDRRFLVLDFIEAHMSLDEAQQQEFDLLLTSEKYKGAREMMTTTFEKGLAQGMTQGRREMLQIQLEAKFGPLSEQVLQRLAACSLEQLNELARAVLTAPSLKELGLED